MQALKMILKQEKSRRVSDPLQADDLTKTVCQPKQQCMEYSLVLFQNDLIIDVSRDLKKCTASPIKNTNLYSEPVRIVYQTDQNLHISSQDEENMSTCVQDSSDSIWDCSENHSIMLSKPQSDESEEAMRKTDSNYEVSHPESSSTESIGKSEEDLLYQNRSRIENRLYRQNQLANANTANANSKSMRKLWMINDAEKEHGYAYRANLRDATNSKFKKRFGNWRDKDTKIVDNEQMIETKILQRNPDLTIQRVWKPPGVNKTAAIENKTSLQSTAQKSSRFAGRSIASARNKQILNEYDPIK